VPPGDAHGRSLRGRGRRRALAARRRRHRRATCVPWHTGLSDSNAWVYVCAAAGHIQLYCAAAEHSISNSLGVSFRLQTAKAGGSFESRRGFFAQSFPAVLP
jgi:hypothetical protein